MPDTDRNIVYGHGSVSPESIRRRDKQRRVVNFLVPAFRRDNKAYFQSTYNYFHNEADKESSSVIRNLYRRGLLGSGQSVELNMKPLAEWYSTVYARVTPIEVNDGSGNPLRGTRWSLYIANKKNQSHSLFYVETSEAAEPDSDGQLRSQITKIEAIDPGTGNAFAPNDYDHENEARLYETVGSTFDRLNFYLLMDSSNLEVTTAN